MFHRFTWGVCVLGLVLAGVPAAQAANYAFIDLGAAGDTSSYAYGINSSNEVTGSYSTAAGSSAGYVWSPGFGRATIPTQNGGTVGIGFGINDYGSVVGISSSTAGNQAFLWTPTAANGDSGTLTSVYQKLPGSPTGSRMLAINDAGQMVGFGQVSGTSTGLYWDGVSSSGQTINGPVGGSNAGWINAGINSSGLCVGYNQDTYDCATTWQSGNANATNINPNIQAALVPSDTCDSRAFAVNNGAQIVGYYQAGIDINFQAFLYNNSTNIVALGSLGGDGGGSLNGTNALAINANGDVVGYSATSGNAAQHAFLWTPTTNNGTTGSMVDLNNELVNAGAVPSGFYLYEATGINSSGSICGYTYNGQTGASADFRAFALIATLPGDANLDGKVDINDLTIVLAHYGQTGEAWQQGEFTGDGTVDINDLTIVLAHYNDSAGSSAGAMAAVPEPTIAALALSALAALSDAAKTAVLVLAKQRVVTGRAPAACGIPPESAPSYKMFTA